MLMVELDSENTSGRGRKNVKATKKPCEMLFSGHDINNADNGLSRGGPPPLWVGLHKIEPAIMEGPMEALSLPAELLTIDDKF